MFPNYEGVGSFKAILNAIPGRATNQGRFVQPLREEDS